MLGFNIIFLVLYILFYIYIYKRHAVLMIVFFYLFYGYLSMVLSVFYLDLGNIYAFEVNKNSIQSNGVILMGSFYVSSFLLFLFWYKRRKARLISSFNLLEFQKRLYFKPVFIFGSLWFAFFVITIVYLHLFYSGVPLLLGYAKGTFWSYAPYSGFFEIIHNQTSTILLVLGLLYAYIKEFRPSDRTYTKYKKYFILLLFIYLLYIVLMGHKFGGPLLYLFSFYISTLVFYSFRYRLKMRALFKYLILFILFFIPVIWYVYENVYGFKGGAFQIIFARIFALQGQVWHFIYTEVSMGYINPDIGQLGVEIQNAFLGGNRENVGINYLMQFIMPQDRLNSYLEQGVRLSGGYPAYLFVIFKNYGFIFLVHLLFSWLIFIFHYKFLYHLINLNLIKFILWFKLAFLAKGFLFMGDLGTILSFKTIFYLIVLLGIYLFEEQYKSKIVKSN